MALKKTIEKVVLRVTRDNLNRAKDRQLGYLTRETQEKEEKLEVHFFFKFM